MSRIPTQVLAEYVKERFNVDGIIYYSSLVHPNSPIDKRNIILFTSLHDGTKLNEVLSIQENDIKFKSVRNIKYYIEDSIWELFR